MKIMRQGKQGNGKHKMAERDKSTKRRTSNTKQEVEEAENWQQFPPPCSKPKAMLTDHSTNAMYVYCCCTFHRAHLALERAKAFCREFRDDRTKLRT